MRPEPAEPSPSGLDPRELARGLGVAAAAGVFLAAAGAFQTHEAGWAARLAYWGALMGLGALWGAVCAKIVMGRSRPVRRLWLRGAVLTLAVALPFTLVVWAGTALFFDRPLRIADLPGYLPSVLLIAAAMTAVNILVHRARGTDADAPAAAPGPAEPPRFLERLPPRLRGAEIHAVEAEDHYLRVHTSAGSDLILMRLSDAVAELEGLDGARAHRSWWVARAAVREVERGDGRAILTLVCGLKVPVSRTHARTLRALGWW